MRVKFEDGQQVGGIYRWYIDKFINTQRGLGINTIWFLSVYKPGYASGGNEGLSLLEKSYDFLNEGIGLGGFHEAWKYMLDTFGDGYVAPVMGLSQNSIVFLLSKEVTIPGVSLDVNQQPYPATGGSGVITGPTITSARKNNDHISIEMYLTDFSFPNVILRPWIRALSIYGMTDWRLRGKIVFTQLTKRNIFGPEGNWQVSNVITLENAYPVSIPSYNMNYQGADIDKTMSVEWGYDIIKVENDLDNNIDSNSMHESDTLNSTTWGASVVSPGGETKEPLKDTGGNWNEPNQAWINWSSSQMDHRIDAEDVAAWDKENYHPKHWVGNGQESNKRYKVSVKMPLPKSFGNEDSIPTPDSAGSSLRGDYENLNSWVPYDSNKGSYAVVTPDTIGDMVVSDGDIESLQWTKNCDLPIKIKNTFGTGTHDAKTGTEDTVMLNGWPFALHHYIPAFYNLFDFLTKNPAPKPKLMGDVQGDTPVHNGTGNINESMSPDDDSTITGDIAKKDGVSVPLDDTPYKYDSLGITKIGEVPPNDSNITGDIPKKDNEKVKTPDTPGSRLTVPMIQGNVPTDDHVDGRLSYSQNVNTPTDDHITGSLEFSNTRNTPTDDSRRDGEPAPYIGRSDDADQDYRKTGSGVGYKNLNTEPQGQVLNGQLQSYVPRGTTNGPGIGDLYSEIETPANDVPLFAEVAKKIIIDSGSLSVKQ